MSHAHDAAPAAATASDKKNQLEIYVSDSSKVPEFTVQAVILGFILSIVFNAANAYLGLKIGLTVSASIPAAIISMGVLRIVLPKLLGRDGTILENMIVHSIASNGESLAAAIIFTVPALLFLGGQISNGKVFLLGASGGILGMLMMIPLRYSLVVTEHDNLPFPEGTACAKVLIAGDKGGASAAPVFVGGLVGGLFKFAMSGLGLFKDTLMWSWPSLNMAAFGYDISPLLVGVGYLVGLEITAIMLAGGLLGFIVLIPLIHAVGGHNIVYPGTVPIDTMSTNELWSAYVRYIGAGGVAFGGLISLVKSLPDIGSSIRQSLKMIAKSRAHKKAQGEPSKDWEHGGVVFGGALLGLLVGSFAYDAYWKLGPDTWSVPLQYAAGIGAHILLGGVLGACVGAILFHLTAIGAVRLGRGFGRTEHDLPLPIVGIGVVGMFLLLWLVPAFDLSFLEAIIVILFCFFFVAVSARMVGLIGTTNQPVSGMTITALLSMTLLFVLLGHDKATVQTAAIMGGAVTCIAISLSGDLSQDMKTAIMVGATPWKIQLTHIMGTLVSAVRSGFILLLLYWAYGFGAPTAQHPHALAAPQSQLMAVLVKGATGGQLPWTMLLTGAGIGLMCELCGISALAFAIGLYLPITNWPMMFVGGLISWYVMRKTGGQHSEQDPGSLFASGLIAGDALMGIALAMVVVVGQTKFAPGLDQRLLLRAPDAGNPVFEGLLSTGLYAGVCYLLYRFAMRKPKRA